MRLAVAGALSLVLCAPLARAADLPELPEPPPGGGTSSGGASGFAPPDGGTTSRPIAGSPGTSLTGGSASLVAPGGRDTGTGGATPSAGAPSTGSSGSSKDEDDGGCSVFVPRTRQTSALGLTFVALAAVVARLRRQSSSRRD